MDGAAKSTTPVAVMATAFWPISVATDGAEVKRTLAVCAAIAASVAAISWLRGFGVVGTRVAALAD
jgi:hypothetical protein